MHVRLFIASALPEAAKQMLGGFHAHQAEVEALAGCRIKWVLPEQWHLTWHFLGNVEPQRVEDIKVRLASALAGHGKLSERFAKVQIWPTANRPGMLVATLSPDEGLMRLAANVRAALPEFPADKPFRPHVTLARFKPGKNRNNPDNPRPRKKPGLQDWQAVLPVLPPETWPVDEVGLFQSTLTPQGPLYDCLAAWPLR